ncbi:MAG: hypothetical protein ACREBI_01975 [Nitrosotalea sp.]
MSSYRDENNGEDSKSKKNFTLSDEFAEFLTIEATGKALHRMSFSMIS